MHRAIIEHDLKMAFDDGYRAGVDAAQPKWISVQEDIPVNEDEVLVLLGGKDADIGWFNGYDGGWRTYGCVAGEVTHWMPLPSAPNEEA